MAESTSGGAVAVPLAGLSPVRRPSVLPGASLLAADPAAAESLRRQNSLGQRANIAILAGSGGVHLAEELTGILGLPPSSLAHCVHHHFADGESLVEIKGNVRGRDVFIVQSLCHPVNDNLIELSLMQSALSRASAGRVTAIVPYLAYSRQTRKTRSRVPISSADVATLLEECGLNQLVCVDVRELSLRPAPPARHLRPLARHLRQLRRHPPPPLPFFRFVINPICFHCSHAVLCFVGALLRDRRLLLPDVQLREPEL